MRPLVAVLAVGAVIVLGLSLAVVGDQPFQLTLRFHPALLLLFVGLLLALGALAGVALGRRMRARRERPALATGEEAFAEHHRFLRRLDHELKNPLTAILVGVSNLRGTCALDEQQQVLRSIETQTKRLSRIVTDLRKLAEIETLPLEEEPFDVRELLEEAAALAQEQADPDRRLTLVADSAPGALLVMGDRDLFLVAVHNLLDNALKFSRSGDRIELKACRNRHHVTVQVNDTGLGILAADRPLVWEELYRGQNTDGIPGSGIGLTLVQMIVKRSHGEVSLDSQPGRGTTVTIRVPGFDASKNAPRP